MVPWGCLQFVIVVFPDHTHLLFFESTFSTDPWWSFKEFCFRKDIHQLHVEHPLRMQASSRFWLP